jgi:hypothetical protein
MKKHGLKGCRSALKKREATIGRSHPHRREHPHKSETLVNASEHRVILNREELWLKATRGYPMTEEEIDKM